MKYMTFLIVLLWFWQISKNAAHRYTHSLREGYTKYRIAGNFRVVQNIAIFADKEVCAKIKSHENLNSGVNMTSLLEMRMRGDGLDIDDQHSTCRLPIGHQRTTFNTSSTIREANEAVRSAATKQSAKRGSYAKFTPEQQAEVAKYASMHGMVVTSHQRFHTISRFHDNRYTASPLDPMEVYVCTAQLKFGRGPMLGVRKNKKKTENFCWRLHRRIRENMHPRKFPAIRYIRGLTTQQQTKQSQRLYREKACQLVFKRKWLPLIIISCTASSPVRILCKISLLSSLAISKNGILMCGRIIYG